MLFIVNDLTLEVEVNPFTVISAGSPCWIESGVIDRNGSVTTVFLSSTLGADGTYKYIAASMPNKIRSKTVNKIFLPRCLFSLSQTNILIPNTSKPISKKES